MSSTARPSSRRRRTRPAIDCFNTRCTPTNARPAAGEARPAGGGAIGADDIDARRLPGAVGPDQAADLWPVHRKGAAVEGDDPPEVHDAPLARETDRAPPPPAASPRLRRAAR